MIKLSKRLKQIANYVPLGTKVADIGTDHALLPCYLVQERIAPQAVAADIAQGPLEFAQSQVKALMLADLVSVMQSDGLKALKPGEVETVIIAGMGGSTIKKILSNSPEVVNKLQRIIVQPNVAADVIRVWAINNKWNIIDEEIVLEDERYYEVVVLEPGEMKLEDDIYLFIGPKLVEKFHVHLVPYLRNQLEAEQDILKQLEKSNNQSTKNKAEEIIKKWDKIRQVIKCRLNVEI